jgi:class 3 adenylate cyclase/alpha-beta hydrolase superfamily lysophospholipase
VTPTTRYARSGDVSVAYQVVGAGPVDVVFAPGFISHVELTWEDPLWSPYYERLASFSRLVLFDKRGTGLSDPVPGPATLEERTDDLLAVMDAAESERAAIFGISEGGSMAALFAATFPQRTSSLVLYGAWPRMLRAPDFPFGVEPKELAKLVALADRWGDGVALSSFAPSLASDPRARESWARLQRAAASPGMVRSLLQLYPELDIRDILPAIRAETLVLHRAGDRVVPVGCGRYLAEHIPGARYVELQGDDHLWVAGDTDALLDEVEEFVTGSRHSPEPDRILVTILFTDIVGSTERAAAAGDQRWAAMLEAHHAAVRRQLERFRGREIDTAGDGFFVAFDGPARGIRCAVAIRDAVRSLGLEIRAGLHTGECEKVGGKLTGIAVNVGARVGALAGSGEVLVSSTVVDLVAGSGLEFEDRGEHELKGVPGPRRLFAVEGPKHFAAQ